MEISVVCECRPFADIIVAPIHPTARISDHRSKLSVSNGRHSLDDTVRARGIIATPLVDASWFRHMARQTQASLQNL